MPLPRFLLEELAGPKALSFALEKALLLLLLLLELLDFDSYNAD